MAYAAYEKVYYTSLDEVFEDVHLNHRLAGIGKAFGKKQGQALATTPRIRWELTQDRFLPAEMGGEVAIRPGAAGANQLVEIDEFDRRDAGALILLYADSHAELTKLLIAFRGALSDVLRTDRVYQAPTGNVVEPETDSDSTWCYRMPLTVRLICADYYPVTSPTDSHGDLGSTS